MDDIKLQKDASRGARAESLLKNELLIEAFAALEKDYTDALFLTKPQDQIAREKLYLAVNVTRKVKDHLNSMVQNGKLAQKQLNDIASETERKKLLGII